MKENTDSYKLLNESEEMYKNIISNLIDIIVVLDLKGNFLYVSPQIYDISGFKQEELIGKSGFKFMHPDDIKKAVDLLKEAIEKGKKMYIEYRTIHKKGHYIDVSANGRIVNMEGEDRVFAIMRDISEQKSYEKKLKESENMYKTLSNELEDLFDRIPDKIFCKNRKGEYTQVNQAFADTFNLNKEEIIGKTSFDFFPSDHAEIFHENDLKVMRSGKPQLNEMNVDFEGEIIQLIMNKIPQFNSDGNVIGLIGITSDNSQQIAYEREIIESEKKYRQLIEDSLEGVWVIDENANTTLVNPSMARIFGYEVDEMKGRNLFDFTAQEDIEFTKNNLERRKRGVKEEIEKIFIRKDGKKVITRLMTSPIFDDNGSYKGAIALVANITERKTAEKLLKESEAKYSHLFMSSPYSIIIGDMTGKIIDCNFKEDKITGYTREDIIGKNMIDIPMFPHKYLPIVMEDFKVLLKGGIPKPNELQIVKKDGSHIWVQPTASIFKLKDKMYLQIIMQNIEERKISEEKLKESEEKFRTLFEIVPASIVVSDLNGKIVLYNHKFCELHGVKNPELLEGKNVRDFFTENDLPKLKEAMNKSLEGTSREINHYKMLKEDGTEFLAEAISLGIKDKNGKVIGLIGVAQDITERRKAEQELQESEKRLKDFIRNATDSISIWDSNLNLIEVNKISEERWGVAIDIVIGKNMLEITPSIKETGRYDKYVELIKNGESISFDNVVAPPELEERYYDIKAFKVGKGIGVIGNDITDRIKSERKIKESEEKYRTLTEQSFLGIAILQDDLIKYVNKQLAHTVDYTVEEIMAWEKGGFLNFIYPKDRKFIAEQARKKQLGESDVANQYQFRGIKKNGDMIWLEVFSKTINYRGKPADFVTIHDITDEKISEQKLKESEEKFRMIAEHSFMGILITIDNKIEYVNNALLQIFEYSGEEITNWTKDNIVQMIHSEDLQFLRDYREKLRKGDPNVKPYYSYRVFTKSGKLKWIDQFSTVINYKGQPAELVTIMDISEKKVAEQELVKLSSLKSELMRRTSHELKTPLVSIKGYSDLLLSVHKEKLDDYVLASIVAIKQGCERLESLIQDILNTAELESGAVQLNKIVDDLSFFIKLSVRELQGLARLRNHTINLTIPDKMITSFEPEQIRQVISNLINNAIKYTPPDETIEIGSEIKDNLIIVSIKDNGIGVTKEEKERLFTQFGKIERYGQGLDIISDGSGLGLYISKKIVELHGGKIWVESEGRNKGSTFYFTLPIIQETIE